MAGRPLAKPRYGNGIQVHEVDIKFRFNSTSDPAVIVDPNDDVATIVYSATSIWTLTFNYPVQKILSMQATVQLASVADVVPQFGATSTTEGVASTALAVPLKLATGASASTAPSSDADNWCHLHFTFEMSPNLS